MVKKQKEVKKKSGIEGRIQDVMDINTPTIISIFGRPGSGKTSFLASCPKPLLIVDVKDKGTDSVKSKKLQRGDVEVFEVEGFDDIYDIYDYIVANPDKYATVCIDHLTALQDFANTKVLSDNGKDKMSQQMFGFTTSLVKEVIGLFKNLTDLGILPIFIVQDRVNKGDEDGEGGELTPEVSFGLMPSLQKTLGAASRVIAHCYLEEVISKADMKVKSNVEYRMRLGPNAYYLTKVTRPLGTPCPDYLVNPTYQDLEKVIKGQWEPEERTERVKKKPRKNRE